MKQTIISLLMLLSIVWGSTACGTAHASGGGTQPPGFTPSSHVDNQSNGIFRIGAEALMPSGFYKTDLAFALPPNQTIVKFQTTASWNAPCQGDVLAILEIDGVKYD